LAGKRVRGYVNRLVSRSGEPRTIRWSGELLRKADGSPDALLAVGEDITERERADQEMRRLERRARERERLADIGAIAAKLVHDLGNPLSGLSMQAQLLQRRAQEGSPEGIRQPAERIMAAAARLNELIRSFMDFAREQRLDLIDVDISVLLGELLTLWGPVASEAGIMLALNVRDGAATVRGDDSKLRRVFDNLIRNAIEAVGSQRGSVTITVSHGDAGMVRVCIDDDGPGVSSGVDVFRLFETTKANGTGIGLAVAKQIVVAHGGTITFADRRPHGASFTVELPENGPDC
jgi:signal transduction histidine kinase